MPADPLATTRLAPAPPPCGVSPGDVLAGRFRLGAVVGWGGQAVVFEAADLRPPRRGTPMQLAVKVVRTDLTAALRAEAAALLKWEAGLLRRLRHPALPRLAAVEPNGAWMARELVPGAPLTSVARQVAADARRVQGWAAQLCALLRYLHTRTPPVICGDLKPANLILRPDGTVALIDLGAAQTRTRRPPRQARPRYGTPGYAPPEQLGGRPTDERSDLFSLAATCYELLTGIDPALTPLVFDHARLTAAAPQLAPALRAALDPDPARRPQTAAALHAAVARTPPPAPLALGPGVVVGSARALGEVAARHPHLFEACVASGACEAWLADHSEPALGALLHDWRAARQAAPRARPHDSLLAALAPAGGSALLRAIPGRLAFGDIPLRQARAWGAPRRLALHNDAAAPLRWELACPQQQDADVRVLIGGRALRKAGGVIPPGARVELDLVAAGKIGDRRGMLELRCGIHTTAIPWEGTARAGLPVGHRVAMRVADLDPAQPGLVGALEVLAERGALQRWLGPQGYGPLAARLSAAVASKDRLALRMALGELLHPLSPARFPLVEVRLPTAPAQVIAGSTEHLVVALRNRGSAPGLLRYAAGTAWVHSIRGERVLLPGGAAQVSVAVAPPADLPPGVYQAHVTLRAGDLDLPLALAVEVAAELWWQRALRWLRG